MTAPAFISLCDRTGIAAEPWAAAGYDCWLIDLAHERGEHRGEDGIMRVGADVRHWHCPRSLPVTKAFAWPPCTDLAISGARWFKAKGLRALAAAIDTFGACVYLIESLEVDGFAENPGSVISSHYRKPDYSFDPCEYAGYLDDPSVEAYTKRTYLWAFRDFVMPPPEANFPHARKQDASADKDNGQSRYPISDAARFRAGGVSGEHDDD